MKLKSLEKLQVNTKQLDQLNYSVEIPRSSDAIDGTTDAINKAGFVRPRNATNDLEESKL